MSFESLQKIIKVGSSLAVTIPAKDVQHYDLQPGKTLKVRYEVIDEPKATKESEEIVALTQKLINRHKEALEHLRDR